MAADNRVLPVVKIFLNKKEIDNTDYNFEEIDVRMALNSIPFSRIVISGVEPLIYKLLSSAEPGKTAEVKIEAGKEKFILFEGDITERNVTLEADSMARLTLSVHHVLHRLRRTLHSQIFTDKRDSDVIKSIFSSHKIQPGKIQGMIYKISQLVQYQCSDWQFLLHRLNANNVWLTVDEKKVNIIKPALSGSAAASHTLTRKYNTTNPTILSASWQHRIPQYGDAISIVDWDIKTQKMTSPRKKAAKAVLGSEGMQSKAKSERAWKVELNYGLSLEAQELQAQIDAVETNRQFSAIQATFILAGEKSYFPGDVISIKEFDKELNGNAILSEVRHRITSRFWHTELRVGGEATPVNHDLTPQITGLHMGTVGNYQKDKKNLYRLPVILPVLGDNTPVWARIALPHASNKTAMGFYPNPGDEVVIAFAENDPRYPVILGSVHNPKKPPPAEFDIKKIEKQKFIILGDSKKPFSLIFDTAESALELSVDKDKMMVNKEGIDFITEKKFSVQVNKKNTLTLTKTELKSEKSNHVIISSKKIDLKK
ncbi:TPA: hypothetical protein QH957_002280 [Enterobacter bugandensis]|nr:hypothetical protein [Enterobacter bugandensis]